MGENKKYNIRTYSHDEALVSERRQYIVDHSAKLFIKKGYYQVSMRELAEACKMSIGSIYHYIGTKQDILYLIINNAITRPQGWRDNLLERCQTEKASDVLRDFIDYYYHTVDKSQDICLFTYQETKNLDASAQHIIREAAKQDIAVCEAILKKGVESGELSVENPTLLAHNIVAAGHMWAVRRWFLKNRCTLDEYIREHTGYVFSRIQPYPAKDKQEARAEKWRAKQVHHV